MTETDKIHKKYEKRKYTWRFVPTMNEWWLCNDLVTSATIRTFGEKFLVISYTKHGELRERINKLSDAKKICSFYSQFYETKITLTIKPIIQ